jgi:Rne/Rng family ribonuclease
MNKELFVSATPHETRVGLVEDDLLAEIYLERENEYTLAGSIYKGRVTRVLPGMQSAFVDIGLERDAFLYVSDFMELEDTDDLDDAPAAASRPPQEHQHHRPRVEAQPVMGEAAAIPEIGSQPEFSATTEEVIQSSEPRESSSPAEQSERGGFRRGRRRRGGRRGERTMPESKFARPAVSAPEPRIESREEYGPPAGYEPILLPGESISKYRRNQAPPVSPRHAAAFEGSAPSVVESFPEDEPGFAREPGKVTEDKQSFTAPVVESAVSKVHAGQPEETRESAWDREQKRQHEMNVAAVFGKSEVEDDVEEEELDDRLTTVPEHSDDAQLAVSAGTLEEEEIEDEEADLAHYVEELEEDEAFEEMEEETTAAGDHHHEDAQEIAAVGEAPLEVAAPFLADPVSEEQVAVGEVEDAQEEAEAEDELEEAQAEAEALLDAEARGNGTVDARVEVRAPVGTAGLTQPRPRRPGFDRRPSRGRRSGGGRNNFRRRDNQQVPQISDLLKEGQEILVQIAKEPIGKKGARITSHIALPGRFLVYMPTVNHTGVSRKIASEEERQRLKRIIISERENGHGGFIVRTAAQNASEDELRADIRFLKGLWNEIKERAENGKAPALIYHDLNVVERVLRDQVTSDFSVIWVDNEQEYERILRFANRFQPALVRRVKLYSKETPLYDQFGLNEEINKALKSKVWLKSGGYIVINQTEALVAIDVNTGKYVGKTARLEDTIVKTNVDAIKEIVRQIRLRDLGGIIVIDFIDMDERRNRQKVMQALEEALRADRAPSKVLQFNDFGLVAITRKRVKQSLERTIGSPCPYCASTGFVKSVTTVCNEIYVEMRKIAKHLDHADVMLRVNPEVAKALKAGSGRLLAEMEEMTKKTVIVKSDPALHQEQFDVN